MFKNHLTTAWRNLRKNKLQAAINIAGLAIGIAGCLTVFLLAKYELRFNSAITHADRIYRVYSEFNGAFSGVNGGVPTGMPALAVNTLQGTDVQCLLETYTAKVRVEAGQGAAPKNLEEQKDIVVAGPEFFDLVQNFEWLAGSPRQALSEPFQVVLTEGKAQQLFGMADATEAMGRTLVVADSLQLTVSGILKAPDFYSDFYFSTFISSQTIHGSFLKEEFPKEEWNSVRSCDQFFIKASEGVSIAALEEQLKPLNERFNAEKEPGEAPNLFKLQPLSDLHFNQQLGLFDYSRRPVNKATIWGLMLIAGLLLLIAAINFINLATVQATRRSKETGIRKAIGASRGQLTIQFLTETALIALLALPVAIVVSEFALRYFSEFLPAELSMNVLSPGVLLFLLGAVITVTFLAGLYPAFVLSSFLPAFAIKNQLAGAVGRQSARLRKGMIIFQFVLAQAFIIGAMVMGQQLHFVLHKDLGFDKDAVVFFYTQWKTEQSKKVVFQKQLELLPEVKATSVQNKPPIDNGYQTSVLKLRRGDSEVKSEVHFRMVDTAYLRLFGIQLRAGRNLQHADTTRELVVNEAFTREMGLQNPTDAIGELVDYGDKDLPIVGVVRDFHVRSFHHAIPPVALIISPSSAYCVAVKINTAQIKPATLAKIKGVWASVFPGQDFQYFFLNETVGKLYQSEAQLAKLINTATGLAILLSCLGLFGLAFFTVTQRSKEISIRKVLGASVASVVGQLSKDFLILVVAALVIAAPLAYYFMENWLADFAYRIAIPWWVFVLTGLVASSVAFLTVGFQSVKAALANPVESLRSE
jgi:ABC-type antimicrobial peptide transport system permease subunit